MKFRGATLVGFATNFFAAIGVTEYAERESENYIEGHYFKGEGADGMNYVIAVSDEEDYEDFPFWVQVMQETEDADSLIKIVDTFLKDKIIPAGFSFIRVINLGRKDQLRIDY